MNIRSTLGGISTGLIIALALLAASAFAGVSLYGFANSTRTEAIKREIQLSLQYQSNQNYLSTYISTFYEQAGIANAKSDKMNEILLDAVKGRYGKEGINGGQLMTAIAEAYPDVKGLDVYDKIMTTVSSGREGYRAIQDKLLDQLGSYDTWRKDGILRNMVLKNFLPSDNLVARIGDTKITGQAALDKMYQVVLASQAVDAYKKSTMEPLKVPSSNR